MAEGSEFLSINMSHLFGWVRADGVERSGLVFDYGTLVWKLSKKNPETSWDNIEMTCSLYFVSATFGTF